MEIAKLDRLTPEDMRETIEDFYGLCVTQKVINEGGVLYAKDVLEKAFGSQQAASYMERLSKILNTAIPEHEELMIPLVKEAVSSVKNAEWIDVQISERLPHLVELLKTEFAQCKNPGHIEITAINAPQDTCIINTSDGAIDATASVQIFPIRSEELSTDTLCFRARSQ